MSTMSDSEWDRLSDVNSSISTPSDFETSRMTSRLSDNEGHEEEGPTIFDLQNEIKSLKLLSDNKDQKISLLRDELVGKDRTHSAYVAKAILHGRNIGDLLLQENRQVVELKERLKNEVNSRHIAGAKRKAAFLRVKELEHDNKQLKAKLESSGSQLSSIDSADGIKDNQIGDLGDNVEGNRQEKISVVQRNCAPENQHQMQEADMLKQLQEHKTTIAVLERQRNIFQARFRHSEQAKKLLEEKCAKLQEDGPNSLLLDQLHAAHRLNLRDREYYEAQIEHLKWDSSLHESKLCTDVKLRVGAQSQTDAHRKALAMQNRQNEELRESLKVKPCENCKAELGSLAAFNKCLEENQESLEVRANIPNDVRKPVERDGTTKELPGL